MKTWQRWQDAQATLQKKRESEARLLWANKPDKLQQAKEEITEVSSPPKLAQHEYVAASSVNTAPILTMARCLEAHNRQES